MEGHSITNSHRVPILPSLVWLFSGLLIGGRFVLQGMVDKGVVVAHLGGTGLDVGNHFWRDLAWEHGLSLSNGQFHGEGDFQLDSIHHFFEPVRKGNVDAYNARCVFIDSQPADIDYLKTVGPNGILHDSCFVTSNEWHRHGCRDSVHRDSQLVEDAMEQFRQRVERLNSLQGFVFQHSTAGAAGTIPIFQRVADEYSKSSRVSFSITPSPKVKKKDHDHVVGYYNTLHHFETNRKAVDATLMFDTHGMYLIGQTTLNRCVYPTVTPQSLDGFISGAMSNITAPLRFPCQTNGVMTDLNKMVSNLTFFGSHSFLVSHAPLEAASGTRAEGTSLPELVEQLYGDENTMANICHAEHKILHSMCVFRGRVGMFELRNAFTNFHKDHVDLFSKKLANPFQLSQCEISPRGHRFSATAMIASNAAKAVYDRIVENYQSNRDSLEAWLAEDGTEKVTPGYGEHHFGALDVGEEVPVFITDDVKDKPQKEAK